MDFLSQNPGLTVVNSLNLCEGLITRKRETINGTEEAVLDFFLVNQIMLPFVEKMVIDEKNEFCLTNFGNSKTKQPINTDHKTTILYLNLRVLQA